MLLFGITYGFDWYARVLRLACGAAFLLLPLIQLLHLEGEDGVSEGEEGDTACGEAAAFARWSAALRVWYISVVASPPYWLTHSLIMAGLLTRRLLRAREGYSPPPISASSSDLDALKAELHSFDSSHRVREFFVTTKRDGVRLAVQAIGSGEEVLLCGHGLGCSAVFALPIMRRFDATEVFKHFTIVFWDYRGLFGSSGAGSGTEALPLSTPIAWAASSYSTARTAASSTASSCRSSASRRSATGFTPSCDASVRSAPPTGASLGARTLRA